MRRVRNDMRYLASIAIIAATNIAAFASEPPALRVEDSGSKSVDALVLRLISKSPAPYPSAWTWPTMSSGFITPEVQAAIDALKRMGPPIFPALVKHLADDRYSYSGVEASWVNYSVGHAVLSVFCDDHWGYSGYKSRRTPGGSAGFLSFEQYFDARGREKWADWASTQTRVAIQEDFINWSLEEERKRGFIDDDQRKQINQRYELSRERVRKEYSEPGGPANRGLPVGSKTNRTSATAGPGG